MNSSNNDRSRNPSLDDVRDRVRGFPVGYINSFKVLGYHLYCFFIFLKLAQNESQINVIAFCPIWLNFSDSFDCIENSLQASSCSFFLYDKWKIKFVSSVRSLQWDCFAPLPTRKLKLW